MWEWFSTLPVVRQAAVAGMAIFLSGFAVRGAFADILSLRARVDELEPKVDYLYCVTRYTQRGLDPVACEEQLPEEMRRLP